MPCYLYFIGYTPALLPDPSPLAPKPALLKPRPRLSLLTSRYNLQTKPSPSPDALTPYKMKLLEAERKMILSLVPNVTAVVQQSTYGLQIVVKANLNFRKYPAEKA